MNTVAASRDQVLRRLLADPEEPYSEWFVRGHSPEAERQLALCTAGPTRAFMAALGDNLEPGGALFVLLRKRWVEDQVRAAVAEGWSQLVVVGAGYDTLGLRLLRERPALSVFEVDHPATQAVKRRALEGHGALPGGLRLLAADLSRGSLAEALGRGEGFRPGAPAVLVAEGVLMYLGPSEVDQLFAAARGDGRAPRRLVFTAMDSRLLADPHSAASRTARFLALSGEPLRSSLDPESLEGFLVQRGFRLRDRADHRSLRAQYLEGSGIDRPLGEGEWMAVADGASGPGATLLTP